MIPSHFKEICLVLLFCGLTWLAFSLALYLADNLKRKKEAIVGGLLILVLTSVLGMLSGFAAEQLQTSLLMIAIFQCLGIFICTMAVSRVCQMLSWGRTWLAALLALLLYLAAAVATGWGIALSLG